MAPPGGQRRDPSNPACEGYLWSKLYHILKGQALSCLVFLRSDPSDAAELCREDSYDFPFQRTVFKKRPEYLRRRPGRYPRQPWRTKAASEHRKEPDRQLKCHGASRYAHEGQHGRGAASAHPDGEENDEQGGGKHHLPGVGGGVSNGQGERHGAPQTWRTNGGILTPKPWRWTEEVDASR